MPKQDVYTYYYPDGRVEVREGELVPDGAAWIDGAYHPPLFPSALNVRVGRSVAVATVIASLHAADGNVAEVLVQWDPLLTREDVDLAVWFYNHTEEDKREIDARIAWQPVG